MDYLNKIMKFYRDKGFISATLYFCKAFLKCVGKHIINLIYKCMRLLIIKEYIVFECESDFADNPRTFYEYLLKIDFTNKHKIIWIVKNVDYCKSKFAHKNVVFINRYDRSLTNIIHLNYYLAVSRWFIFSHPFWFSNWRKGQIVINTTHSVAQLKSGGNINKEKKFDYVLSCSNYCSKIKEEVWHITPKNIICLGMPRIDLMFDNCSCKSKLINNYNNEKLIVSMETFKQAACWHDSEIVNSYAINVIDNEEDLLLFDDFLGKNKCKMIIKIHHLQNLSFLKTVNLNNISYLTDNDLFYNNVQINTLLTNADILLTDYSSVFYDYLIVDRPIGFLLGDFDSYSRGFLMDNPLDEMPGEKIYNIESLKKFIELSINGKDNYKEERASIRNKTFKHIDNNNCERLYRWMFTKEDE